MIQLVQPDLEMVLGYECLEKPTSILYAHLLRVSYLELSVLSQSWSCNAPELNTEGLGRRGISCLKF